MRSIHRLAMLVLVAALCSACSSDPPTTPTPPVQPPPVVPAPVITALTVAATRAEPGEDVAVAATVTDAMPASGAVTYQWSANVGRVIGTGPSVVWRLDPGVISAGVDVVVTLTVVKPYQALENGQLVTREHRVTSQASPFRAHDSNAEVTRLVRTFLIDYFGDITVSPDACLVDFSSNRSLCPSGRDEEYKDVSGIRADYAEIVEVQVRVDSVILNGERNRASVQAPCLFRSKKKNGEQEAFAGTCELTAVYDAGRWWLCESYFRDPVAIPFSGAWPLGRSLGFVAPVVPGTFPDYFR